MAALKYKKNGIWTPIGGGGSNGTDGEDGYSPSASVEQTDNGAIITITDKNGTTTANITNGKDGADGVSPTVEVSKADGVTTINITDTNGTKTATINDGADGNNTDDVPEYVRTEASRVAKLVQSRQNANTISFLVGSDIHARLGLESGSYQTERMLACAKHAAQAMEIIRQQVHIDFGAILGDILWDNGETAEQAMEMYRIIKGYFAPSFVGIPQFWAKGNHDMLGNSASGEELTETQIFSGIGIHNNGATFDSENRVQGYCYRDFSEFKLRVICMNTTETKNSHAVGASQLEWLQEALNLSTLGAGWRSIILSHMPLDWWGESASVLTTVAAFAGTVLCNIHGHLHNYLTGLLSGTSIPRVCIPNIDFYRTNEYGENDTLEGAGGYIEYGEEVSYEKVADSAEDTAFCVVTIDIVNNKLYADHYGAGYDREVDLNTGNTENGGGDDDNGGETATYTNLIPLSTTTFGGSEIYGEDYDGNGTADGYKTGTRIGSDVTESAVSGMCCTGFIAVTAGATLRVKNVVLSGASTPYLLQYTTTGGYHSAQGVSVLGSADGNGVYTYTIPDSIAAIRLSVGVIDGTSIITVNEPIA